MWKSRAALVLILSNLSCFLFSGLIQYFWFNEFWWFVIDHLEVYKVHETHPYFCIGLKTSLEEGNGNPLQYSCLENSMDRGSWLATVHGVSKCQTLLSDEHTCTHTEILLSHKKERNNAICSNVDGLRLLYWVKSERERQIPYDITYMRNLKYDPNELIYERETDSQI